MKKPLRATFCALPLILLCSCWGGGDPGRERLQSFVESTADLAIQKVGTAYLKEKAPFLVPLLDTNEDGFVSLDEVRELEGSPESMALLIELLSRRLSEGE